MEKTKEGWKGFIELCLETNDEKGLTNLFELLLTPEEKESIAMRYLIIRELLQQKRTQREIAKYLNVSIAKITRGSNELKRMKEIFIQMLREKFRA